MDTFEKDKSILDGKGEPDEWITVENGQAVPVQDGQTKSEAIKAHFDKKPDAMPQNGQKKMTPAEKIASVHIDFSRDNLLPELNENDLIEIGANVNKKVLIKKSILERNKMIHSDIGPEESNKIIGEALYNPARIFKGNKAGYYHFAQIVRLSSKGTGEPRFGTVLLDINENLNHFEVVHWYIMVPKELDRAEKKNK